MAEQSPAVERTQYSEHIRASGSLLQEYVKRPEGVTTTRQHATMMFYTYAPSSIQNYALSS